MVVVVVVVVVDVVDVEAEDAFQVFRSEGRMIHRLEGEHPISNFRDSKDERNFFARLRKW